MTKIPGSAHATVFHCKSLRMFPEAKGQLTPQSEVGSVSNSNPSKLLWLPLLPARMKKIQAKMKVLEWSTLSINVRMLKGS